MNQSGIILIKHDPTWALAFQQERVRLEMILEETKTRLKHIGSTAIAGIAAKPVIDLMYGCDQLDTALSGVQQPLEAAGYVFKPEFRTRLPGRLFFSRTTDTGIRTHHLHIVEIGGTEWVRHLAFRDFLNAFPDVAREYERLKCELAAIHASTIAYSDAKSDWIRMIERQAEKWSELG